LADLRQLEGKLGITPVDSRHLANSRSRLRRRPNSVHNERPCASLMRATRLKHHPKVTSMTVPPARIRPSPLLPIAAATALSLPLGSIYAFSVFIVPLETLLSANRSELASVFGISVVSFTLGMIAVPKLFGRLAVPVIIALSAVLAATGVGVAALAKTFYELAFWYGVVFAFGGGLAYVAIQQCVNAVPLARPGLVNGYLVSLFPLGAMLAAPACGWAIESYGPRTALAGLSAAVVLSGSLATLLMALSGIRLSIPTTDDAANPGADGQSTTQRIVFWKLFFVFLAAAAAGLMVLSQAAAILTAYGAEKGLALAATTGITAAIAGARIAGGWLTDRYSVPLVAAGAQAFSLTGAAILAVWPGPLVAVPTLAMIGIGYGIISGVTAGAVAFYWPRHLFGRIASRVYIAWCVAALTLPLLAARLFDLSGGYGTAVMLAGAANVIGILVGLSLPRQTRA
jgi:hypothetical protein